MLVGGGKVVVQEEMLYAGTQVEFEPLGEEVIFVSKDGADREIELSAFFVRVSSVDVY